MKINRYRHKQSKATKFILKLASKEGPTNSFKQIKLLLSTIEEKSEHLRNDDPIFLELSEIIFEKIYKPHTLIKVENEITICLEKNKGFSKNIKDNLNTILKSTTRMGLYVNRTSFKDVKTFINRSFDITTEKNGKLFYIIDIDTKCSLLAFLYEPFIMKEPKFILCSNMAYTHHYLHSLFTSEYFKKNKKRWTLNSISLYRSFAKRKDQRSFITSDAVIKSCNRHPKPEIIIKLFREYNTKAKINISV